MKTQFVIEALKRIRDDINIISLNAGALPHSAAATAIGAVAKIASGDVGNLLTDFEVAWEKEQVVPLEKEGKA
jgi:hypothetical protein